MPVQTFAGLSGNARVALSAPVQVLSLDTTITTEGITEFRSAVEPRRVMHTGWVGVCYLETSTGKYTITYWKYVDFEFEAIPNNIAGGAYGEYLIYNFGPGVIATVTVEH